MMELWISSGIQAGPKDPSGWKPGRAMEVNKRCEFTTPWLTSDLSSSWRGWLVLSFSDTALWAALLNPPVFNHVCAKL